VNGVSTPDAQGFDYWIGSHHNTSFFGHRNGGTPDFWENGQPAPQYAGQFADDVFVDKAIGFIKENRDKPFFVYLALFTPHAPFQDPADPNEEDRPDLAVYNQKGAKSTGPPHPKDRPLVKKMVEHVDQRIGDLMTTLADLGIGENTLVIFTSDNGPWLPFDDHGGSAGLLRGGKGSTWEGGMREPTIAWWPGTIEPGQTSLQIASTMDIFATACALAGAPLPEDREMDSYDLTPVLKGTGPAERDTFFYYRGYRLFAVRMGPFKAHFMTQDGYGQRQPEKHDPPLLFNLGVDPGEQWNVADQHPEVLAQIMKEVEKHKAKMKFAPSELEK